VPDVRGKEGNVTCSGHDRNDALAIPLKVVIGEPFHGWCLSRRVTSGNQPGRAGLDRAVPEVQVCRDGEHGIRDPGVPGDTGITRDVRTCVDVPEAPEVVVLARPLPPGGIGDDVAVLSQQRFDYLEDPRVADGVLHDTAAIEHLVAKRGRLLGGISTLIRWVLLKDPFDIGRERCDLSFVEDTVEYHVSIRLEAFHRSGDRVGTETQESGRPSEHFPILPPMGAADNAVPQICVTAILTSRVDGGVPGVIRSGKGPRWSHLWE
jgi:hypothetical protein